MFPTNSISFLIIFLILFVGISLCVPLYEWDSTGTVRNVHTFAKFIDDLYTEYKSKTHTMDTILSSLPSLDYNNDKQKRAVFNFTFVKCAAEIAHLRVINANTDGRPFHNFNVLPFDWSILSDIGHYDQSLGHQIANAFEREIFAPAKEQKIAKTVTNQIMQLAFSFAARVLLCWIYDKQASIIGPWQLRTLLSAFKILSSQNANDENGIFFFQIIQIDTEGNHWWKQKLHEEDKTETLAQEQKHYIENFNFILRLSDFELTHNEIDKVLDKIMTKKTKKNDNQTPSAAIYTFMMDHFRSSLLSKEKKIYKMDDDRLDCAMVNFGHELKKRFYVCYFDFNDYLKEKEKKCGRNDLHHVTAHNSFCEHNTPTKNSNQIVMDIFHEPLWNYVRAIKIDTNINKAIKQYFDDVRKLSLSMKNIFTNLTTTKEFKLFYEIFGYHISNDDYDLSKKIKYWREEYEDKRFGDKMSCLKELQTILDEISAECDRANSIQLYEQINVPFKRDETQKFGLIFYETLRKYNGEDKVRYDEEDQLLTFPMQIWEHLISRLCTFVEKNNVSLLSSNGEIDFVSAMDAIASSGDNLESQKRMKIFGLKKKENLVFFEWLFTLAIRLCWEMEEQNDFARKYLQLMKTIGEPSGIIHIFRYKVNVEQNLVRIYSHNWKMPYLVKLEELNAQKLYEIIFEFMFPLLDYSPTIFEIVQMAKILDEMNKENGHIWVGQSDPKIFLFILQNVTANSEDLNRLIQMSEKLKIEGEISADKIELPVANSFCFLSHFVVQLLEKAKATKNLLNIEFPNGQVKNLCTKERIREETMNFFGENIVNIGKAVGITNIGPPIELFDRLLSNHSLTVFEVVKMARVLHEMNTENDLLWVGPSDPKIFLFVFQNAANSAKSWLKINKMLENDLSDKIELSVANSFCFLAHFVVQLLEKAIDRAEYLLNIDIVDVFIGQNKTFCTEKKIREETMNIFGDYILDIIDKQIQIDFNLRKDLQQKILPYLIDELETMINNEDWNCVNLIHVKEVEWVLLEKGLMENGQSDEWKEIKELMDKWTEEFNGAFTVGKRLNFQKTVEELKTKLENLKEEEQKGLGK